MLMSQFQSLNNTISTNGNWAQNFSDPPHCLVMGAIDPQALGSANGGHHRVWKQLSVMDFTILQIRLAMVNSVRHLLGYIDNQRTS